ncbi:MAG: TraB/GumN family protein [Candidatus Hydrogenedentota bacterium]|nr:MAG: TraB/GumN family protein [Candidatus Hydrogenedentota bacterium]
MTQTDELKEKKLPTWAKKLSGPATLIQFRGVEIFILGTAHVSEKSVEDVETVAEKWKPEIIAVELCPARYEAMKNPNRWKELDIVEVIKQKKIYLLMSSMILSAFQKKIGEEGKIKPGAEMMKAIEIAEKKLIPLKLIDRDVQVTLKRAWQNTGYFSKIMILSELVASLLAPGKVSPEEIEKLKQGDLLEDLFSQVPGRFEKIKTILIDERDKYMAAEIQEAMDHHPDEKKILVVIGAGHLQGLINQIPKQHDVAELVHVKKQSAIVSAIKFFLPILLIFAVIALFTDTSKKDVIMKSIAAWAIIKAATVGIVTAMFRPHLFTTLAAMLSAPISNFQPFFKPGWVAALIEAKLHKPSVADFENLAEDTKTFRGFMKNKVARIFSLFIMPQLASSLGTGLALWYIASHF